RDRHRRVQVTRRDDVHEVDVLSGHDRFPVGRRLLPAELMGGRFEMLPRPPADHLQAWAKTGGEKRVDLPVRVAVRAPHERVADERDVDIGHVSAGRWPLAAARNITSSWMAS